MINLHHINQRYETALNTHPAKGTPTRKAYLALADSVADVRVLMAEIERLRERQESHHDLANEAIRWERAALDAKEAHDALHAQLDAVQSLHRKMPVYDILMDDCHEHDPETHGFEVMVGEWYCDQHISFYTCSECYSDFVDKDYWPVYPCPTIRATKIEKGAEG